MIRRTVCEDKATQNAERCSCRRHVGGVGRDLGRWYTDSRSGLRDSFDEALKCGDVPEEMRTRVGAGYLWRSELIHEDTARSRSLAVT